MGYFYYSVSTIWEEFHADGLLMYVSSYLENHVHSLIQKLRSMGTETEKEEEEKQKNIKTCY